MPIAAGISMTNSIGVYVRARWDYVVSQCLSDRYDNWAAECHDGGAGDEQ